MNIPSSILTILSTALSILSTIFTLILLCAGARYNDCGHGGCVTINCVSINFLSITAPYDNVTVSYPNSNNITTRSDTPWIYTWHLSAFAAHPPNTFSTEDGPKIFYNSPVNPFDFPAVLHDMDHLFNTTYRDTISTGFMDSNGDISWGTVTTPTAQNTTLASITMIPPFIAWMLQLLFANLAILAPLVQHFRHSKSDARKLLRAEAALMGAAALASLFLAIYITSTADWAARQLRKGTNSDYLTDVHVTAKGMGLLWTQLVALVMATGLSSCKLMQKRAKSDSRDPAQDDCTELRSLPVETELDAPPPPYSRTDVEAAPKYVSLGTYG